MVLRKSKITMIFWALFLIFGLYNAFLAGMSFASFGGLGADNYVIGGVCGLGLCLLAFLFSFFSKVIYKFSRDDGKQISVYSECIFFTIILFINVFFRLGFISLNKEGIYGTPFSFESASTENISRLFSVSGCSYVYSKMLSLVASAFGTAPEIGSYIQLVLHVITLVVIYFSVKVLMGKFAAIFASLLYSALPYSIISVTQVDAEMLFTCMLIGSIGLIAYVCYQSTKDKLNGASGFSTIVVASFVGGFTTYLDKAGLFLIPLALVMFYLYKNKEGYYVFSKFKPKIISYVFGFIVSLFIFIAVFGIVENHTVSDSVSIYFQSFTNIKLNIFFDSPFRVNDKFGIISIFLILFAFVWMVRIFKIERDHGSFLIILPLGLSIISVLSLSHLDYIGTQLSLWCILGGMGLISLGKNSLLYLDAEEKNKEYEARKNKEKREKAKQELISQNLEKNKEHHAVYRLEELPVLDKNSEKRISKVKTRNNIDIKGTTSSSAQVDISQLEATLEFLHPEIVKKEEDNLEKNLINENNSNGDTVNDAMVSDDSTIDKSDDNNNKGSVEDDTKNTISRDLDSNDLMNMKSNPDENVSISDISEINNSVSLDKAISINENKDLYDMGVSKENNLIDTKKSDINNFTNNSFSNVEFGKSDVDTADKPENSNTVNMQLKSDVNSSEKQKEFEDNSAKQLSILNNSFKNSKKNLKNNTMGKVNADQPLKKLEKLEKTKDDNDISDSIKSNYLKNNTTLNYAKAAKLFNNDANNVIDAKEASDANNELVYDPNKAFGTIKLGGNNTSGVKIITNANSISNSNTPITTHVVAEEGLKALPPLAVPSAGTPISLPTSSYPVTLTAASKATKEDVSKKKKYKTIVEFGKEYVIEVDDDFEAEKDNIITSDDIAEEVGIATSDEIKEAVNINVSNNQLADEKINESNESDSDIIDNKDDLNINLNLDEMKVNEIITENIVSESAPNIQDSYDNAETIEVDADFEKNDEISENIIRNDVQENVSLDDSIPALMNIYRESTANTNDDLEEKSVNLEQNETDFNEAIEKIKFDVVNSQSPKQYISKMNNNQDRGDDVYIAGSSSSNSKKIKNTNVEEIVQAKEITKPAIPPVQVAEKPNIPTNKFEKHMGYKTAVISRSQDNESSILSKSEPIKPNMIDIAPKAVNNEVKPIHNPLPLPKKHVPREQSFDIEPLDSDMHFDLVDLAGKDFFDIN